jgi:hypothetical protein
MNNKAGHDFEIIDGYFDGKTVIKQCKYCFYTYEHVGDCIFTGEKEKKYELPNCVPYKVEEKILRKILRIIKGLLY